MILEKNISQSLVNIVSELKNQTKTLQGTLESVLSDEMSETLEMTKRIASHGFEQGKNILKFFASSLALQKLQFKKSLVGDKKTKGGLLDFLFKLLAPLGAAATMLLHPLKTIKGLFKSTGLAEGFKVSKITGPIKILSQAAKRFPLLSGSAKLLGKTFTKLFWPIQAIISTVEFIKGYMAGEELSWQERVKNGMAAVVKELIEMPARLLGKSIDWTGKKLGFKMEGDEGQAIVDNTMKSFDIWYDIVTADFKGIAGHLDNAGKKFGLKSTFFTDTYNDLEKKFDEWYNSLTTHLGTLKDRFLGDTSQWGQKMKDFLNLQGKEGVWIDVPLALENLKTTYGQFKNNLGKSFDDMKKSISDTWKSIKEFDLSEYMGKKLAAFKKSLFKLPDLVANWIKGLIPDWVKTMFGVDDRTSQQKAAEANQAFSTKPPAIKETKSDNLREKQVKVLEKVEEHLKQIKESNKTISEKSETPMISTNPNTGAQIQSYKVIDTRNSNAAETGNQLFSR